MSKIKKNHNDKQVPDCINIEKKKAYGILRIGVKMRF